MKTNCDEYYKFDYSKINRLSFSGLNESVKILESMGGWCRGQIVDISKREEVYKAAADIKSNYGDVSIRLWTWIGWCKDTRWIKIWLAMYEYLLLRKWRESVKGDSSRLKRDFFAIIEVTFSQCSQNEWKKRNSCSSTSTYCRCPTIITSLKKITDDMKPFYSRVYFFYPLFSHQLILLRHVSIKIIGNEGNPIRERSREFYAVNYKFLLKMSLCLV